MPALRELYFRYMGLPSATPLAIEVDHADGIYFYDTSGKRYTDLVSGVAVSNVGHRHPRVLKAIEEQLDKYLHLMVYGEYIQSPQVRLAEKLCNVLPDSLGAVYFVNSGSEAIEGALKLAKRHTARSEVISFKNAYHGGTAGALSILGNERLKTPFRPLIPGTRLMKFNDLTEIELITEKTAAVVLECVQAEAGIIPAQDEFLRALRKRCSETASLLIVDDIQMGFGRTGTLFSFEHYDIVPDILCLAKGMGGGMPIGAFISSREIMNKFTYNPELGHITTFGGHPVSCAASMATLELILEEDLQAQAEARGEQFEHLLAEHPAIRSWRRKGLMIGVEMEDESTTNKLVQNFLDEGLVTDRFLFMPEAFRIAPPLIISEEQVEECAKSILKCMNKLL